MILTRIASPATRVADSELVSVRPHMSNPVSTTAGKAKPTAQIARSPPSRALSLGEPKSAIPSAASTIASTAVPPSSSAQASVATGSAKGPAGSSTGAGQPQGARGSVLLVMQARTPGGDSENG